MHHLSSNTPSTIFHGPIFPGHLLTAKCTVRVNGIISKASDFSGMIAQIGNKTILTKQLRKAFHYYPILFRKLGKLVRK